MSAGSKRVRRHNRERGPYIPSHGRPVRRAGSEKIFATRHRFEKERKDSSSESSKKAVAKNETA